MWRTLACERDTQAFFSPRTALFFFFCFSVALVLIAVRINDTYTADWQLPGQVATKCADINVLCGVTFMCKTLPTIPQL